MRKLKFIKFRSKYKLKHNIILEHRKPISFENALNNAYKVKNGSSQIIGIDLENKQIVIFNRVGNTNVYHGQVRNTHELSPIQKNILIMNKLITPDGGIGGKRI
ncbi:MAG: hypothetical protein LN589_02790 [Rickettsia endosymbiont of Eriopis connexa]|nr:hypothetical protein [Rickettsia endosymbiont of Eriopis connexa]